MPTVRRWFSDRSKGDFSITGRSRGETEMLRRRVVDYAWSWCEQVHGTEVHFVNAAGPCRGQVGDALVTTTSGQVLGVQTADCVPVLLWSDTACAAVHGGWRGLSAGVIEAAYRSLRVLAPESPMYAQAGPHICPRCYEFGSADLATLAFRFGPDVVAATSDGQPAVDLFAAVTIELERFGVVVDRERPDCTAHSVNADGSHRYYSYRARREAGRNLSAIWIEP